MNQLDPDHKVSSSYKANLLFNNSGLERKEREKLLKESKHQWDYEKFKEVILDRFETTHELDIAMVKKSYRNRFGEVRKTYLAHDPDKGVEGTDLYREDCDEAIGCRRLLGKGTRHEQWRKL